jgi:hypothetical protein
MRPRNTWSCDHKLISDTPVMPGLSSIDLTILVSPDISVRESHDIESRVRERIMSERKDAREVKIHIHGVEPGEMEVLQEEKRQGGSDFGRDGC